MSDHHLNTLIDTLTGQPIPLAMQSLDLSGRIYPMGAVLKLTHRFRAAGDQPMEAIYHSMLPRGASLRRFKIKGKNISQSSTLQKRAKAVKTYENGVAAGHLSSLAEINQDGMVSLSIGQVRPKEVILVVLEIVAGVEMTDRGLRFRFPFTVAPTYQSQMCAKPCYFGGEIPLPGDIFSDLVLPPWNNTPPLQKGNLHQVSFHLQVDGGLPIKAISSPSHRIEVEGKKVTLAGLGDSPNRDLVVDVKYKKHAAVLFREESLKGDGPKWTAVLPSSTFPTPKKPQSKKVCIVLDHSSSMGWGDSANTPMDQAKRGALACLSTLTKEDRFGLLRFNSGNALMQGNLIKANARGRDLATEFIRRITPSGGTELWGALSKAADLVGSNGQIFLLTDGQVSGVNRIVDSMKSRGITLHCLGIGDASQDRFLAKLASSTGGITRMVGTQEDVALKALELFQAVKSPLLRKATAVWGQKNKAKLGTLWANQPVILRTKDAPPEVLSLSGKGYKEPLVVDFEETVMVPKGILGLFWASQEIEKLEGEYDLSPGGPTDKLRKRLQKLSKAFGLASREMSLVAVVKRKKDKKNVEMQQTIVATGTVASAPSGMRLGGRGSVSKGIARTRGRRSRRSFAPANAVFTTSTAGHSGEVSRGMSFEAPTTVYANSVSSTMGHMKGLEDPMPRGIDALEGFVAADSFSVGASDFSEMTTAANISITQNTANPLLDLLATLEPDGGLPGNNLETRVLATALLGLEVLEFQASSSVSVFLLHLSRMADFLETHRKVADAELVLKVVEKLRDGTSVLGSWGQATTRIASVPLQDLWAEIRVSV